MSPDSFDQYKQAVDISFTDHHPPMMSIWWSFLLALYASPVTLLIFHLLMLWSALYLLAQKYNNNYILLIGLLPFVVNFSGVLWKDVGLTYSYLLAFSIFLSVKNQSVRRKLFLLFIFYGTVIRPNVLLALFPILMYFYHIEFENKLLKSTVLSALTIILFIMINNIIVYGIFDTQKLYAGPKIVMIHDLSGISKLTGQNYFPPKVNEKFNVPVIIKKYKPELVNSIFWGKGENFSYEMIDKSSLFYAWKSAVLSNPQLYLNLRIEHFKSLLRIGHDNGYIIWYHNMKKRYKENDITFKENILYKTIKKYVFIFHKTFWFYGWFWLICSGILLLFWKRNQFSAILGLSSILYILPYFIIGQAPYFRYIYLSVLLVLLGSLLLFYPDGTRKENQDFK